MAKKKPASAWRMEKDTLGAVRVPADALWGAQTQRAVENYPISGLRAHPVFIRSFLAIKKASALANFQLGTLDRKRARAISDACDEITGEEGLGFQALTNKGRKTEARQEAPLQAPYIEPGYASHFVVDVFQAGAGTSFNMNCNEVLANLANRSGGGEIGSYQPVNPNDHVNMSQSTNDTYPTALRIATLLLLERLYPGLESLAGTLQEKGAEFADVVKSGRTHLQDAVPVTLGQEFAAWGAAMRRSIRLLRAASSELSELGIGGTATGTGINTPRGYRGAVTRYLTRLTGLQLKPSRDPREAMQSQLPVAAVSGALRNLALELTRITNDLRLLASGPHTGLAEISLPSVQPGSSIMPGKVNPSMLECMNQILYHVIGSDTAVAHAVAAGQLELNVMMPLMSYEILFSIEILSNFLPNFVDRCVAGITADRERCEMYYSTSPALATVLNPLIGYAAAAEIAKESAKSGVPIPDLIRERGLLSEKEIAAIFNPSFLTRQADR